MSTTTTTDFSSIGFVCQTLQQPPGKIRRAAETLGIRPVCINGLAHYDDQQVASIRDFLDQEQK